MSNQSFQQTRLSLRYIFYRIFSLLPIIVICMIFGGLSALVLRSQAVKQYAVDSAAEPTTEVKALRKTVAKYEELMKSTDAYLENSVAYNADGYSIYTANLQYFPFSENDINQLMNYYKALVNNGNLAAALSTDSGLDVQYQEELISYSVSGNSFTVTLLHSDEVILKSMVNTTIDFFNKAARESVSKYGENTLELLPYEVTRQKNDTILSLQKNTASLNDTYQTKLTDAQTDLKIATTTTQQPAGTKRYLLFGVLGGFFGAVFLLLIYLANTKKMLLSSDFRNLIDTPMLLDLGYYRNTFYGFWISFCYQLFFHAKADISTSFLSIAEQYRFICAEKSLKITMVFADSFITKQYGKLLSDSLSSSFESKVILLDTDARTTELINAIQKADSVLLIGRGDHTSMSILTKTLTLCETAELYPIGIVALI